MAFMAVGPLSGSVSAVVIDLVNAGSTNMSAPADDPGWNNVGAIGFGGGVYIGYGWVLTANHVGASDGITLGGVKYAAIPGTGQRLTNNGTAGKSALTDLYMFRINAPSVSRTGEGRHGDDDRPGTPPAADSDLLGHQHLVEPLDLDGDHRGSRQ
jgi:hypothetical protein